MYFTACSNSDTTMSTTIGAYTVRESDSTNSLVDIDGAYVLCYRENQHAALQGFLTFLFYMLAYIPDMF